MDENQAKQSFANYISFRTTAKEELEDIKQITNSQKQQEKVNSAFEKHSRNFLNAQGLLNSYNINGEVNMNDFWNYSGIVEELKKIKDKYEEENIKSINSNNVNHKDYCSKCDKVIIRQYLYSTAQNDGKKFCSQQCFDKYYVCDKCKQTIIGEYYKSEPPSWSPRTKGITCVACHHGFCSECCQPISPENYYFNKVKEDNKKFCSENCFVIHYEKQLSQEEKEKKIQEQERILRELEKSSQERKKMGNDFNRGLNDYAENQKNNSGNDNPSNLTQQSQLRSQIMNLQQKPNKTPTEQAELEAKRKRLQELEKIGRALCRERV